MMNYRNIKVYGLFLLSIIFIAIALTQYIHNELSEHVPLFILLAIASGAVCFFKRGDIPVSFIKKDFAWMLLLLCIVSSFYLYHFYTIPLQINTDEIAIMNTSKVISTQPDIDILGVSYYLGFAAYIFYVFGKVSTFLGGIDLYHYRLAHVLSGVMISVIAYAFFRQLLNKHWQAFGLALWLASNHALFAISRMAMRDNSGLLIELLALTFLVYGWKANRNFWLFLGGVVAALSFYTYFPSRVTFGIWVLFVFASVLFLHSPSSWKEAGRRLLISVFGFLLVVPFMLISSARHSDLAFHYSRQQFLFYPEGRALQQGWVNASTPFEGWITNIKNGLGTFNNHVHDLGYIYPNYGHGFVDPLTGALLWIGAAVILWRWLKDKKISPGDLLCLIGFASLYFTFAFIITKAPNYTRLFVTLPFVVYLAGQGAAVLALWITKTGTSFVKLPSWSGTAFLSMILMIVMSLNGLIFFDFVRAGIREGNDVGSTARYVLQHRNESGHHWILASNKSYMYFNWSDEGGWREWIGFFAAPDQSVQVVAPAEVTALNVEKPFTVFLSQNAWQLIQSDFTQHYPWRRLNNITPDGRLLAVEVSLRTVI